MERYNFTNPLFLFKIEFIMRCFYLIFCFVFLTACNDGDILTVELEFDKELELCTNDVASFLIYDLREDPNESLSLIIPRNEVNNVPEDYPYTEPTPIDAPTILSINGTTIRFIYRTYNRAVANGELCNVVPPADLNIVEDYEAATGTVEVITTVVDDDNDGIPTEFEGLAGEPNENGIYMDSLDTDEDGIPDYLDDDDDNDNVKTINEIDNTDGDNDPRTNPLNTDADLPNGDIIPDYLDIDDDGDGVNTINEDENGDQNPRNDSSINNGVLIFHYLNNSEMMDYGSPGVIDISEYEFTRTVSTNFAVKDIDLEILRTTDVDFGVLTTIITDYKFQFEN